MNKTQHRQTGDWKFSIAMAFFCILSICMDTQEISTENDKTKKSQIIAMHDHGLHHSFFSFTKI